ncbi:MAG: cupin domain-containing protein [Haloarculaceae archaeon]
MYTFDVLNKDHFDVELKRYPAEGGESGSEHTHEMDELYYVIAGSGTVSVGEDTHAFESGEMIFVEAGVEHEFLDREAEIILLKVLAGS